MKILTWFSGDYFSFILEEKYFLKITNNFKNILLFIDYIKSGH